MDNEFICKAALATIYSVKDLSVIKTIDFDNEYYRFVYTQESIAGKFYEKCKLKVVGNSVVGFRIDTAGDLIPITLEKINFEIIDDKLVITTRYDDGRNVADKEMVYSTV
ncbi:MULTISPECIES: hypothetical protein [Aeromonas]|uniref:hypothetical protein n=1 Tax=Aeromonas TaxID=642 RepID=UPI0004D84A1C|nr:MULTISPECIES: hypothetical protein [Aeromonas]KEP91556.1 hypothetical protein DA11_04540 [Aeromonas caviae]MBL0604541.1 hypothetical protein [Aeromonas dhakensis]BED99188.1 hypothetical protein VAWG001_08030 [Aeromonas dhakensis]